MHTQSNITNIILKLCFLTIRILSKLPQSPGNGISENLNLEISSGLRPSFPAPNKRASYGTAFCNMSLRKLCVFLFVNCIFIFRIPNTFVASYAMKYSEIFFFHCPLCKREYNLGQMIYSPWYIKQNLEWLVSV
jgi:hypothetical protein